ncbi:hypothetical protein H4W79_001199 [Nocardiopsis terrae]|uniref:Uncharacterized protein n=1 Tax=Nocardiopsis terrae TaxID=372655 RepID=A0ABR9HD99_9ACTN|nr:hypothetical protein [Nocardiopsis terrae]
MGGGMPWRAFAPVRKPACHSGLPGHDNLSGHEFPGDARHGLRRGCGAGAFPGSQRAAVRTLAQLVLT